MSAGKGDKPRNCHSEQFKKNYDEINWSTNPKLIFESKKKKAVQKKQNKESG
jgi:hypothetical protein